MNTNLEYIYKTLQMLDDEKGESLISVTYACFFEVCPEAEALWEKDDPVSRGKMFNGVILTVMDSLTRPEMCENNLISDVKDHDEYGVNHEMYGLFFGSLVKAFSEVLGEDFSADMAQAWKSQLGAIEGEVCKHSGR